MHFLFISQVYPPDPAATGQYYEDAALELARRGHRVLVFTADRDYDDPRIRYDSSSRHSRIKIVRLPFSSFGKRTILHRLLGQGSFLCQCLVRMLICRGIDGVVITTIPATTGVFFLFAQFFRKFRYLYWVMDVNPDQAVALGVFSEESIFARLLRSVNHKLANDANKVVCMDSDMATRLGVNGNVEIISPWPLDGDLEIVPKDDNPFVVEQGWQNHFVFMYSGNHSLVHPLDTVLDAIGEYSETRPVKYVFIGGGRGKEAVERSAAKFTDQRIVSLPYQALEKIKYSLSAADVHIVSFGNEMVGIVHPCKLYSAMALGKPILFLGPKHSALGQIIERHEIGWCVGHGDQKEMRRLLRELPLLERDVLLRMGTKASMVAERHYSREKLCGEFCEVLEDALDTGIDRLVTDRR